MKFSMKNIPAKFYLALGLTSLLTSILLVGMFLKMIPDPLVERMNTRVVFGESVASSSSLFLQKGDFASIRSNLEFSLERNSDLLGATVTRNNDQSSVELGTLPDGELAYFSQSAQDENMIYVPILRNDREWGSVRLYFSPLRGGTLWEKFRNSKLAVLLTLLAASFISFYFYLGKMLKQLNPSAAVPGRVRSALDTLAESLLVINRKGELVLANEAFGTLMGRSTDSLLATRADALPWSREEDAESELPWVKVLATGEPSRHDMIWLEDHAGARRKFIVNCSPVAGRSDRPGGVLISLDDVTLLEQKEDELIRSKQEADEANQAKSDFLSNMSHEIRTPMTAILGFTEVLKRGYSQDVESSQKYLDTISRSGKHLLQLINDILDLSKVESGALEVESIACSPHMIIHDVIQVLNVKAEEKSIYLKHEITESLPEKISSDPARLRQIITNLVGNAIKFTESGGVSIAVRLLKLNGKDQIAIDVTDTGIGMNEKALAGIFEAFSQADTSITRRFGGTGLGLSISKDLSKALGGDITVTSKPGEGSTFTATIDSGDLSGVSMISAEEIHSLMLELKAEEHARWSFLGSRALVVDDAAENRDLLTLVLNEMDIEVEVAENGAIGVDKALAGNFDIVLMDIQMPVMDGYEAVSALMQQNYEKPVVALTANAMKGFEDKVLKCGFTHYMTKPIDIDKLTVLLSTVLEGRKLDETENNVVPIGQKSGQKSQATTTQDEPAAVGPIYSTLSQKDAKFQPIAESFIERLTGRLEEMDAAVNADDMDVLAGLAHWLKGSGGSVGFGVFTEPAKSLELAAKSNDTNSVKTYVDDIKSYAARLDASSEGGEEAGSKRQTVTKPVSFENKNIADESQDAASPIVSVLAEVNAGFREIIRKFIPRLEENLTAMQKARDQNDLEELASLAHWLKGSGGTVGFNVFTEPARALEISCKASDLAGINLNLENIISLAGRLVAPREEDYQKSA